MAQRNANVTVSPGTWVALSDGAVAAIRVQNRIGGNTVQMAVTLANTAPTDSAGSVQIAAGEIWPGDVTLVSQFGGTITANGYVWASCDAGATGATVSVSHA